MVRWFHPLELVRAGTKAMLSSLFGAYADWREVQALQAALSPGSDDRMPSGTVRTATGSGGTHEWFDLSDRDALWVDYTADLGDGFDATYTMARLLAERRLSVGGHETERGQMLVMGGDQVYPTASRTEYQNRLTGPYRAALPWVLDETPPLLFAVPGNHDWYDGLTSFLRLFTQGRWIGGWKTVQRRSYFAIKLPHDWWLWGIDIQLDADVDAPQLDYFRAIASREAIMPSGSKVVLCTPEPSWVFAETKGAAAYDNLGYLEDEIIRGCGHEMAVGLAGDLHAYARYAEPDTGKQRFIAGGGGAYLYPTHDLPDTLDVETPDGHEDRFTMPRGRSEGTGDSVFPARSTSLGFSWRALLLPFKNPVFGAVVAALYLLFAWLVQSATVTPSFSTGGGGTSLLEHMATAEAFGAVLGAVEAIVKHAPGAMLLVVVLWGGLSAFADLKSPLAKAGLGAIHTAAHLVLAVSLMWGGALLNLGAGLSPWPVDDLRHVLLFSAEVLVAGAILGGGLMGLYLLLTNRLFRLIGVPGVHANELFSCQHLPNYKHVLRLHVEADGLTIYPIGVRAVETRWSLRPDGAPEDPWFDGETELTDRAELIEPPIRVP